MFSASLNKAFHPSGDEEAATGVGGLECPEAHVVRTTPVRLSRPRHLHQPPPGERYTRCEER